MPRSSFSTSRFVTTLHYLVCSVDFALPLICESPDSVRLPRLPADFALIFHHLRIQTLEDCFEICFELQRLCLQVFV
jgi:hypothetical protein